MPTFRVESLQQGLTCDQLQSISQTWALQELPVCAQPWKLRQWQIVYCKTLNFGHPWFWRLSQFNYFGPRNFGVFASYYTETLLYSNFCGPLFSRTCQAREIKGTWKNGFYSISETWTMKPVTTNSNTLCISFCFIYFSDNHRPISFDHCIVIKCQHSCAMVSCNELVRYRLQHNRLVVLRAHKVPRVWLRRLSCHKHIQHNLRINQSINQSIYIAS